MQYHRIKNYLGGRWLDDAAEGYAPLFNPSTGEQFGEVPLSSQKTSVEAVESSYEAFLSWRKTPISKRVGYIFAMREAIIRRTEDLAISIALDQGKHISEARGEIQRVIQILETACGIPSLIQGTTLERIGENLSGRVIRQPLGVFCGVAPFNFPALVFAWFIPFAIGAGNTFVYKPSTQSPLFMQKMVEIFEEIGLPKGVVNIIHGHRSIVEPWYNHRHVMGVCAVGSTPTAKEMAQACGKAGKRSMLLGGAKNYLVVMEDADMDVFIENFLNSAYGSAGQRCLAGSVVAIVPEIYDPFVTRMVEASRQIKVGNALDPDVFMGPVISKEAKHRIHQYIEIGIQEGSTLMLDGRNPVVKDPGGYYVGPTIFTDVTPCRRICKEEIFGPVVSIVRIQDLDDALGLIHQQEFGNGACIFTQNLYYTEKFIAEADVGMVGVNVGIPAPHPYLPFGGIKDSHLGTNKVQGKDGIDFFTQNKIVTVKTAPPSGYRSEGDKTQSEENKGKKVRSCVAG
ncbi:MAG: aldehyde dehydrogenase family protein [Termitinemataceae bacterium]